MSGVDVAMMDGSVLISEPQGAVHHAYDMIRLETMRRQIQRMLNDKVGSLKRLPLRYALALQTSYRPQAVCAPATCRPAAW